MGNAVCRVERREVLPEAAALSKKKRPRMAWNPYGPRES